MNKERLFTHSYCAILAANFMLYFGFWLLVPILPFYLKEVYGCREGEIGLMLCCYTISALLVRPFSGYLMDSFSRKPLYLFFFLLFTLIFAGYMAGGTLMLFVLLRTLHGFAFGGVTVGGNTLAVDIMPSSRRGEGLGYYGLTNNIAMSIGPMVGLFLHDWMTFDEIFSCGFIVCLTGFVMASLVKAPSKPKQKRPPLSLDRFILLKGLPASLSLLMLSIPYGATTNYVAMYAKELGILLSSGIFFILMAVGMGVSRIFAGKWVDRGAVTQTISRGFILLILAFAFLAGCVLLAPTHPELCTSLFFLVPILLGVGFGVMFPAYNTLYVSLAPNNQRATATSTYLTAWDVGIGIGIVSGGALAQHFGFSSVYLLGAFLCVGSMCYFNLKVTPHYLQHKLK